MAGGFMLVNLEVRDGEPYSVPIGITAFGRQADELMRIKKGELLTVSGHCQGNRFESKGETREQIQIVAESVIGPKSARSTPRKQKPNSDKPFDDFDDFK